VKKAETTIHNEMNILLVEDNPADVRITLEAFKEGKIKARISVVNDGVEAMNFLKKKGNFSNEHLPDLVLLDLNLPKKDGREVLEEMKEDPDLKSIPVIILTSSKAEEDIQKSYQLHCNCYLTKPVGLNEFETLITLINDFWLTVVELPSKHIN
jgi:chemotaxis family two-component system response regulator Rcp1